MHTERNNICDKELEHVFEQKDLGVIIDSELRFEEHVSAKIRVANAIVGLIRRSFLFLDGIMFRRLYAAFVRPHFEYAKSVWAPHTHKNSSTHLKTCRSVQQNWWIERLIRLNLLTLAYRRRRGDMIEIHKHFNSYDQNVIPTSFQPKERVSRKHKFQLYYKRSKEMAYAGFEHNSFYFRTSKLWNNLPSKVVHVDTKNTFKNRLDVFWKDEPIMYDHTASIFKSDP